MIKVQTITTNLSDLHDSIKKTTTPWEAFEANGEAPLHVKEQTSHYNSPCSRSSGTHKPLNIRIYQLLKINAMVS